MLLEGVESRQSISRRFGLSTTAMHRHAHGHLKVATGTEGSDVVTAESVGSVDQQQRVAEIRRIKEQAMEAGNPKLAMDALKLEATFEAEARKAGAAQRAGGDLATSSEWVRLRGAILAKLEPYPEARAAVVEACLEVDAAE